MSTTRTSPAWALPGLTQRPGLAAANVAVGSARTAVARRPRRWRRRRRWGRRRRRPALRSRSARRWQRRPRAAGSPLKPVPSSASTSAAHAVQAPGRERLGRRAREALGVGPRVAAQVVGIATSASTRTSRPGLAQQPRRDVAVAAVVALARRRRPAGPPGRAPRPRRPGPRPARSIRSSDGMPRSSIAQRSVARMRSASGSGSSQPGRRASRGDRHRAGRRARVGQRDADLDAERGRPLRDGAVQRDLAARRPRRGRPRCRAGARRPSPAPWRPPPWRRSARRGAGRAAPARRRRRAPPR